MGAVAKSGTECGTVRHRVWHFVAVAQFGTLWHRVWHNVAAAAGTSFPGAHLPINASLKHFFSSSRVNSFGKCNVHQMVAVAVWRWRKQVSLIPQTGQAVHLPIWI